MKSQANTVGSIHHLLLSEPHNIQNFGYTSTQSEETMLPSSSHAWKVVLLQKIAIPHKMQKLGMLKNRFPVRRKPSLCRLPDMAEPGLGHFLPFRPSCPLEDLRSLYLLPQEVPQSHSHFPELLAELVLASFHLACYPLDQNHYVPH
jgi:hypothetical protein